MSQDTWFLNNILVIDCKLWNCCISPESKFVIPARNNHNIISPGINSPNLPSQWILRVRSERINVSRIDKSSGPLSHIRIDLNFRLRLLVHNDSSIVVFPSDPPIDLIARKEAQVQTLVSSILNIGSLNTWPVFVMAYRKEDFMIQKILDAKSISIDSCLVGYIVSILLNPSDHWILWAPKHVTSSVLSGHHGSVVWGFVLSSNCLVAIHVPIGRCPAIIIINLPHSVWCLK